MSSKPHRHRRSKSSNTTKQAFEENENDPKLSNQEISNENELLSKKSSSSTNRIEPKRIYEKAHFTTNNLTVEVILASNILSWSTISNEISHQEIYQTQTLNKEHMQSIDLHKVYAVSPIYNRLNWLTNNQDHRSTTDSELHGFQLHSYDRRNNNILEEMLIIFRSNSPEQLEQWFKLLSKIILHYKPSRNILVICNPYAGSKYNRYVYNVEIKPMLERAHHNVNYFEINDHSSADEIFNDFQGDFNLLYGLVIIGGDGSVINVINALIRYLAKQNQTTLNTENNLPSLPFPICIVPTGTTNVICHSIHGNTDHCTPILHLLYNQRMKIDMSAIFDVNYNFVTANFGAGAGYPATALKYFTRYSFLSPKKIIKKSFVKASANKNLKPIDVEIRYIPVEQSDIRMTRCYQGCPSCTPPAIEEADNQVKAFDKTHIRQLRKRKKQLQSENSNENHLSIGKNQKNELEKTWKTLHDNYLQIAVLTNANLCSFAPQGLSKHGHLADGLLDLILIEPTTKKEFIRYLKRNGNSKDQYEFSFTKLIKVKEIEIELKLENEYLNNDLDSSLLDDSSNEEHSNNENKFPFDNQNHQPRPPSAPKSEDSRRHRRRHHQQIEESLKTSGSAIIHSDNELDNPRIDPYGSTVTLGHKNIFQTFKIKKDKVPLPRPTSACGNARSDEKQNRKNRPVTSGTLRPARSLLNLLTRGNSLSDKQNSSSTPTNNSRRRPSIISRLSNVENIKTTTTTSSVNNQNQNKKQPCMWNLDFTPYNSQLIRIKCFCRFLPVFGVGLDPDTLLKEVNYSCFR